MIALAFHAFTLGLILGCLFVRRGEPKRLSLALSALIIAWAGIAIVELVQGL
ncbi:hypothetical protein FIV00_14995 [Labrenzia sp. THAF82]|nr:hypothetical protein FIV00_14995 [Labrenzia sp. THAF82]